MFHFLVLMSSAARWFGRVEFWILNNCCFLSKARQSEKKSKQTFKVWHVQIDELPRILVWQKCYNILSELVSTHRESWRMTYDIKLMWKINGRKRLITWVFSKPLVYITYLPLRFALYKIVKVIHPITFTK